MESQESWLRWKNPEVVRDCQVNNARRRSQGSGQPVQQRVARCDHSDSVLLDLQYLQVPPCPDWHVFKHVDGRVGVRVEVG